MRLYDTARWKRLRSSFLHLHPLCNIHLKLGSIVPATVVDHITPHKGDEMKFWDEGNLQSLCKRCHDSVKQQLEKSGTFKGCDTSGLPLDLNHRWHQGG